MEKKATIIKMDTEIRKCVKNLCILPNMKSTNIYKPQTEGGLGIISIEERREKAVLKLIKESTNKETKEDIEKIKIKYKNVEPKNITGFKSLIGIHLKLLEKEKEKEIKKPIDELIFSDKKELREFTNNASTRKLRFYIASVNKCIYVMKKAKPKSEKIKCRFCGDDEDSLNHWANTCQNIEIKNLFNNEKQKINFLKSKNKVINYETKVKIWDIKYKTYVDVHRLMKPREKTLANQNKA